MTIHFDDNLVAPAFRASERRESVSWADLDWKTIEGRVKKLRKRIYAAAQRGDKFLFARYAPPVGGVSLRSVFFLFSNLAHLVLTISVSYNRCLSRMQGNLHVRFLGGH